MKGKANKWLMKFYAVCSGLLLFVPHIHAKEREYTKTDSIKIMSLLQNAKDTLYIDPGKSKKIVFEVSKLSRESGFQYGLASSLHVASGIYTLYNVYDTAINLANEAVKISKENNFLVTEVDAYIDLGVIFDYMEDYHKAIENFQTALKLCGPATDSAILLRLYSNMGNLMGHMNDLDNAKKYYLLAMNIAKTKNWPGSLSGTYLYLSMVCQSQKKYAEEFPFLFNCIRICDSMHIKGNTLAGAYCVLGECYFRTNEYDSALYYSFKGLALFKENGEQFNESNTLLNIGNIYLALNKLTEAGNYYKQSQELGKKCGSREIEVECDKSLAELYSKKGDYKKAYDYRTAQLETSDSIFSKDKLQALAALTTKFETKELENKNTTLRKESDLQKLRLQRKDILLYGGLAFIVLLLVSGLLLMRQNKFKANQQRAELEQKQLRAQMNPHFIFNCLNSIQHFVVANDVKNANKYLSGFASLMRQTLENSKEGTITLRREIAYLENYLTLELMRFEDKFSYEIICAENINIDSVEIPAMIIQPFIENAIRHGLCFLKDRKGKLTIRFYQQGMHLFCEIDDNGIGREQSQKLKMGSDMVYESHGMELTRQRLALVSKSNGSDYEIEVADKNEANEPTGTTIIIKFPTDK